MGSERMGQWEDRRGRMPNSHPGERAHHADLGLTAVAMLEEIVGRREVEASGARDVGVTTFV